MRTNITTSRNAATNIYGEVAGRVPRAHRDGRAGGPVAGEASDRTERLADKYARPSGPMCAVCSVTGLLRCRQQSRVGTPSVGVVAQVSSIDGRCTPWSADKRWTYCGHWHESAGRPRLRGDRRHPRQRRSGAGGRARAYRPDLVWHTVARTPGGPEPARAHRLGAAYASGA